MGHLQYYCVGHVLCRVCFACSVPAMVFLVMWVFMQDCHMHLLWWLSASWPHWVLGFVFICRRVSHALHVLHLFHLWYRWGFVCTCGAFVCCVGVCCRHYGPIQSILLLLSLVSMGVLYALGYSSSRVGLPHHLACAFC